METPSVYVYDNSVGIDIPKFINIYPVELLLGTTVSEVHKNIKNCKLFCVFTPLSDADIVVQTNDDKELLNSVLKFCKKTYNIVVKETSIWYSNDAKKNIIISNTVNLPSTELASVLGLYLNELNLKNKTEAKNKPPEIYTIINIRRNIIIEKTPSLQEAKSICDKNPCCIVINRAREEIYKSGFGNKPVQYNKKNHNKRYKLIQKNNDNIFKIQLR